MRRASGLCVLVVMLSTLMVSGIAIAATTPGFVSVTLVTNQVSQGGILTLQAAAFPASTCTLELNGPARESIMVSERRSAKSGKLTWRYRIPSHARSGSWKADISCGPAGNTIAKFTVVPRLSVGQLVVAADGFTQSNYSESAQTFISYGVLLENKSPNVDALGVTVSVSFTDTLGRSVATEKTTLTGVPANGSFYVGGLASSNVSLTVASMEATLTVATTQEHKFVLPPTSDLGVTTESFGDGAISGTITNPYRSAIPSTASVYVVYLGPSGNIVGGNSEPLGAAVQPSSSVVFGFSGIESDINSSFISASSVTSVQASVDPCNLTFVPPSVSVTNCPAAVST
jgi:hypothetical protein